MTKFEVSRDLHVLKEKKAMLLCVYCSSAELLPDHVTVFRSEAILDLPVISTAKSFVVRSRSFRLLSLYRKPAHTCQSYVNFLSSNCTF